MNSFINLNNSRREEQKKVMEQINSEKHCPFCEENLSKYHKKPILAESVHWILTENQWPYDKTRHHLLAIHKKHIEHLKDMSPEAGSELIELFQSESQKRKIEGGGIAIRFGGPNSHGNYGNSVLHLHAHLIEPDLEALKPDESWKFKFGQPKTE